MFARIEGAIPSQIHTEGMIEGRPIGYYDHSGNGLAGDVVVSQSIVGVVVPLFEAAKPALNKLGEVILGPNVSQAEQKDLKPIPSASEVGDILETYHPVLARYMPSIENGIALRDMNIGNPHHSSYDSENPESRIMHQLVKRHGKAPLSELIEAAEVSEEDIQRLIVGTIREIRIEDGAKFFYGTQLVEGLSELQAKKYPYIDLFDAPDLLTFAEMKSYKDHLAHMKKLAAQQETEETEPVQLEVLREYNLASELDQAQEELQSAAD